MPTVSGSLIFDINRNTTVDTEDTGIQNVPIVLQNVETSRRITASTGAGGAFEFINVPAGSYILVEAYGSTGGTESADFDNAQPGEVPIGKDPPVSYVQNPPTGTNFIDSVTPNTVAVTVGTEDVTRLNFLDGPVIYTPIGLILDPCVTVSEDNLITAADDGSFGSFTAGTAANSRPEVSPYPDITSGSEYAGPGTALTDGKYTITNIMYPLPDYSWWVLTNYSTGDETGRFQAVNGANIGKAFFQQSVNVTPYTNYLFSIWIANMVNIEGLEAPSLGVIITGADGSTLYDELLGETIPANTQVPQWKEVGTVFNSQNNSYLTVSFISQNEAADGNDYAIDNIQLVPVTVPAFIPQKSVSQTSVYSGESVTYTIRLQNTCTSTLSEVSLTDQLSDFLNFKTGSVIVDGTAQPDYNPETGFSIPDIAGGETAVITFEAYADTVSQITTVESNAVMSYKYTPVEGGILNRFTNTSNSVSLQIQPAADLSISQTISPQVVTAGQQAVYLLMIYNAGPSSAENTIVSDEIDLTDPVYELNGSSSWQVWTGKLSLGVIKPGEAVSIAIKGKVSWSQSGVLENTASVSSTTLDPDRTNNVSSIQTAVISLQLIKTASIQSASVGESYTYSLNLINNGKVLVKNIRVADKLDASLSYEDQLNINGVSVSGDITQGIVIDQLAAGESILISFQVKVMSEPEGDIISNQAEAVFNGITVTSNESNVRILNASISISKTADREGVLPGEIFSYIIKITNTGDVLVQNITVTDAVPSEIYILRIMTDGVFMADSLQAGVNIGSLAAGQVRIMQVFAQVNPLARPGQIINQVTVQGEAIIHADRAPRVIEETNAAVITLYIPHLMVRKSSFCSEVVRGDIIDFCIQIVNEGNIALNNIWVQDRMSGGMRYLPGSVYMNGQLQPGGDIRSGIFIGSLNPGESRIICYKVLVECGEEAACSSTAYCSYIYHIPGRMPQYAYVESIPDWIYIKQLYLTIDESIHKMYTSRGIVFIGTATVINHHNRPVFNICLKDGKIIPRIEACQKMTINYYLQGKRRKR